MQSKGWASYPQINQVLTENGVQILLCNNFKEMVSIQGDISHRQNKKRSHLGENGNDVSHMPKPSQYPNMIPTERLWCHF